MPKGVKVKVMACGKLQWESGLFLAARTVVGCCGCPCPGSPDSAPGCWTCWELPPLCWCFDKYDLDIHISWKEGAYGGLWTWNRYIFREAYFDYIFKRPKLRAPCEPYMSRIKMANNSIIATIPQILGLDPYSQRARSASRCADRGTLFCMANTFGQTGRHLPLFVTSWRSNWQGLQPKLPRCVGSLKRWNQWWRWLIHWRRMQHDAPFLVVLPSTFNLDWRMPASSLLPEWLTSIDTFPGRFKIKNKPCEVSTDRLDAWFGPQALHKISWNQSSKMLWRIPFSNRKSAIAPVAWRWDWEQPMSMSEVTSYPGSCFGIDGLRIPKHIQARVQKCCSWNVISYIQCSPHVLEATRFPVSNDGI